MTDFHQEWKKAAHSRRKILMLLTVLPSVGAAYLMYSMMPHTASNAIEIGLCVLFAILFGWISLGFWSAVAGVILLVRGVDRFSPLRDLPDDLRIDPAAKTALLFPVYNEDAKNVMAGVRAIWRSLVATGHSDQFDIFIISDSTSPDAWIAEEEAWHLFCCEENAFNKVFYRRRKKNTRRKSGNVADFCRRWGRLYRYMIVFDADSLLTGPCMLRMVQAMEANPRCGILQTMPQLVNASSLFSRMQQFASRLYGPVFGAGLHFWQLGDAQFWGHNAIIRVDLFMKHCQLPILPGKPPLGGEIFSHDIVEAALMCRAGYEVWLAWDMTGTYEECPPSMIDELIRARRWCQGNLQHGSLVFANGFASIHRMLFINGIMFYASALLWLGYLICSSAQAVAEAFILPAYFPDALTLFPVWPTLYSTWTLPLLGCTLILLFLPKLLTLILVTARGEASDFGGFIRLVLSILGEIILSTLMAPVRMLAHSTFVISTILGWGVGWNPQNRSDQGTSWGDAIRFHWWHSLLGLIWGWFMWLVNPGFFWWLSPIVTGLVLAIPLSVWTSRVSWGRAARRCGLFLAPVELVPPAELTVMLDKRHSPTPYTPFDIPERCGFLRAVVIPYVHFLHLSLLRHKRKPTPERLARFDALIDKALRLGPDSLSKADRMKILSDPERLHELHRKVWGLDDSPQAMAWGVCRTPEPQNARTHTL
ncbi:MAG TPA: glucans biosynthesis glucosyltransferase MdoH [Candidatus Avidesulfovibrio excrementigallinarum]|nr:glucans biosynthesis glucosyltransferase MdoH [Candidatus Avidesulfovibrio excrementigallinarum]